MRKAQFFLAVMACVLFGWVGFAHADTDTSSLVGKQAPNVSLTTVEGKKVTLADEKGKVVVLDFWATWCPPCRESLPHIQHLSENKDLAAKGLVVWAVNAQETPDTINKFLTANHYTFKVPQDSQGSTMQEYLVHGIPTTVIVGRDGSIKNVFIGFGDGVAETIDAAVNKALAE